MNKLKKIWKIIRFQYTKPFFKLHSQNKKIKAVHLFCQKNGYPLYPRLYVWLMKLLQSFIWPIRLFELALKYSKKAGERVEEVSGKGRLQQIFEIIIFSMRYSLPPRAYYNYQFFLKKEIGEVADYIYDNEISPLFFATNKNVQQIEISDKYLFAKLCAKHSITHAPTIGIASEGVIRSEEGVELELLPSGLDLFVKPRMGTKGLFCSRWYYDESHNHCDSKIYRNDKGMFISRGELLKKIRQQSLNQDFIVQANLKSSSSLVDLNPNSLCCARIVTIKREGRNPEHLSSVLKIAWQGDITNTNGLMSPICPSSGRLGRAFSYRLFCAGFDNHPDTGANIKGRILDDWSLALELALKAHEQFPEYFSLGWDIGFSDSGPILLEANQYWDVITMQRAHQYGFGKSNFFELCYERLGLS